MEDIDGGLHPAVDGQSLDEDEKKTLFTPLSFKTTDFFFLSAQLF